jgi:hypothetical protein
MLWKSNEPDPLDARRRLLAEQERLLAQQKRLLTQQLQQPGKSLEKEKRAEPPVWRMEDESHHRVIDPLLPRKKNLGRQRRNDMIFFFILMSLLLVLIIVLWIVYLHNTTPGAHG